MGRAQALVFVCELKTGETKSLCASVRRLGAKASLKFGIKISLRCQVGSVTLDCATWRPLHIGVGGTCSSIYGDQVVSCSILHN
jgi:hypothetical protein